MAEKVNATAKSTSVDHSIETGSVVFDKAAVKDDVLLETMGYEQHMKRGFTMWSMIGFCLTGLGLLPSLGSTIWFSMGYLGLASMVWGWFVAAFFIHATVFNFAEFGSAYPTAGGLYYWTYLAAPKPVKKIACWITAWSMIISAAFGGASMFLSQAQMLDAFVILFKPDWVPTTWQVYLVYLGNVILCGLCMALPSKVLSRISTACAWVGTVAFFIILIAMPIMTPKHATSKEIFTSMYNQTAWDNKFLVFCLTFLVPAWCISGYDSTVHLSEETRNASKVVPQAMWISTVSVAVLGWIFNIVLAYCTYNIDDVMDSYLGQPLGALLVSSMGNTNFARFLWFCTVVSNFGVIFVMTTSGSRIYFAYARDGALPFHKWMSHVNTVTKTPVNATITICTCIALIGLLYFASETALNALFAGSSLAGSIAYVMPILMRAINENNPDWINGPFTLGRLGPPLRWIAILFTFFTIPIFSFPYHPNPTAEQFKWSVPVWLGIMAIVIPWYFFSARKWFKGPVIAKILEGQQLHTE